MPHAKTLFNLLKQAAAKVPERSLKPLPISGDDVYVIDLDTANDMPEVIPKFVHWGNVDGHPIELLPISEYNGCKIGDYRGGIPVSHIGIVRWKCTDEGKVVGYHDHTYGYSVL